MKKLNELKVRETKKFRTLLRINDMKPIHGWLALAIAVWLIPAHLSYPILYLRTWLRLLRRCEWLAEPERGAICLGASSQTEKPLTGSNYPTPEQRAWNCFRGKKEENQIWRIWFREKIISSTRNWIILCQTYGRINLFLPLDGVSIINHASSSHVHRRWALTVEKKNLRCLSNNLFPGKKVYLTFPLKFVGIIQIEFGWLVGEARAPLFVPRRWLVLGLLFPPRDQRKHAPSSLPPPPPPTSGYFAFQKSITGSQYYCSGGGGGVKQQKIPRTLLRRDRRKLPSHSTTCIAKTLILPFAARTWSNAENLFSSLVCEIYNRTMCWWNPPRLSQDKGVRQRSCRQRCRRVLD